MDREKFAHSRVFVQYDDGSVLGTCSIHCAAVDQAVRIDKSPCESGSETTRARSSSMLKRPSGCSAGIRWAS